MQSRVSARVAGHSQLNAVILLSTATSRSRTLSCRSDRILVREHMSRNKVPWEFRE